MEHMQAKYGKGFGIPIIVCVFGLMEKVLCVIKRGEHRYEKGEL